MTGLVPAGGRTGAAGPRVTVVCTPRDHHHDAVRCLDALLECTEEPFALVYLLGRAPRAVATHVRGEAAERGFTLIERDEHLVPNHARNLALAEVTTEYVAFVDNDTLVTPGWLGALVACADATGAATVGPLQFIGPFEDDVVHVAGGFIDLDPTVVPHPIRITHRFQGLHPDEVPEPLVRAPCDFAEFHCMLARTDALRSVGPLDEGLVSAREFEDLHLRLRARGASSWFEPAARVTFLPPERVGWSEIGLLCRRWGERANQQSYERFVDRYQLDRSHLSALGWANGQRRPLFGWARAALTRVGAPGLGRKVEYVLHRLERPVNRLLVRVPPPPPR